MKGFRVIRPASPTVMMVWGEQPRTNNLKFVTSKYVFQTSFDSCHLLYSCITGEIIEVTDWKAAENYLIRHWFYVPTDFNEEDNSKKIHKLMRVIGSKKDFGYNSFEILTTTKCNARCFYCYETGFKQHSMDYETAAQTAKFIIRNKVSNNTRIKWYGGEPLMNIPAIDQISSELQNNNVRFYSTIVSNGILFTDEIVKKAVSLWNLKNVRITLDGTEIQYNKIKAYKGIEGNPFQIVISNIDKLIRSGVSVTIRLNIEKHNLEDMKNLLSILYEKFPPSSGLIDFMVSLLNNTEHSSKLESEEDERRYILEQVILLKEKIFDHGYDLKDFKLTGLTTHYCLADNGRYLLIKPNGELSFCSEDFDKKKCGTIFEDPRRIITTPLCDHTFPKGKICEDCPISPTCFPSKLCPARKRPICIDIIKKSILHDLELAIKIKYRQHKRNRNYEN